jgi:hypothetical protein
MYLRILSVCLLFISTSVYAQLGSIKGFVYDKISGEPIVGATVQIASLNKAASTDVNGFYNLPKLPAADYVVEANYSGYESSSETVTLPAGDIYTLIIKLDRKRTSVGEVVISRKKVEKTTETRVGVNKITTKEIKALPSVGGEPDIAQYLQVMPGVTFTGDQGGQLYIRGGSPVQNKILLDGMTIYNPFHSIGLFSVFETEAIRSAEVMSGGFGAEYGDRTSAIVNITTKDGNKSQTHGKVGVSPILAKAFVEGPILKSTETQEVSISYVATAKQSLLQRSSDIYKPIGGAYSNGLPFSFTDLYGKVNVNSGNGGKINIFGFNFRDGVSFATTKLNWTNIGVGSNFVISPTASGSLITGGANYSDYSINLDEADGKPRTSKIGGFDAHVAVTNNFDRSEELKYGVEVVGFRTLYEFYNYVGVKSDQDENTTQIGGFVKWKGNIGGKLIYEPGFRFQYYSSLGIFSPEPRIAAKFNF